MRTNENDTVQAIVAEGLAAEGIQEVVLSAEEAAARRLAQLVSPETIDRIVADTKEAGIALDGREGLFGQMMKAVLERALGAEMEDHLGYAKGDPAGNGPGNSRNGSYPKTVTTTSGQVRLGVPRDRNGSFEPRIVPKGLRRTGPADDMILSLYARVIFSLN